MIIFWVLTYFLIGYSISFGIAYYNNFFDQYENMFFALLINSCIWPLHIILFVFGFFRGMINAIKNR